MVPLHVMTPVTATHPFQATFRKEWSLRCLLESNRVTKVKSLEYRYQTIYLQLKFKLKVLVLTWYVYMPG